ncbi:MAG: hypothetical protein ABI721_00280 [Candidatus Dojkabacteria bacterium]
MSNTKNDDLLTNENLDKVEEYFKLKGVIKTLRNDLKDIKDSLEAQIELEKINKKVKELRDKVKGDETVFELSEKLSTTRERLDLIKELIRIDLIETAQEEVKRDGKKLKLVHVLKEVKDDGKDEKKKS